MGCSWILTLHFWWEIEHRRRMSRRFCVVMAGYKKEVILFKCDWHIGRQGETLKFWLCCVEECRGMFLDNLPAETWSIYVTSSLKWQAEAFCLSCFNSYCSNIQAGNPYVYFSMWYMSPKRRWIGISPIVSLKKSCSTVACRTALRLGTSNKRRPNRVGWRG